MKHVRHKRSVAHMGKLFSARNNKSMMQCGASTTATGAVAGMCLAVAHAIITVLHVAYSPNRLPYRTAEV